MDKPRHPFVIQPWKIQRTSRIQGNAPAVNAGKDPRSPRAKAPGNPTSKKTRDHKK